MSNMKIVSFSLSTLFVYAALFIQPTQARADALTISVTPNRTVFSSGSVSSCLALDSHQHGDVRGSSIYFPNFKFSWTGKEHLYIESVRITTESLEIYNGRDVQELSVDEINSMFRVPADGFVGPVTVESAKRSGSPCGLAIGGISIEKRDQAPSFTASVRIDMYAVAEADDGSSETPLIVSTTAFADYIAH